MIRTQATQRRIPGLALEDYQTPFGDYIRAQMATAFHYNPGPSIVRGLEQRKKELARKKRLEEESGRTRGHL